MSKEYRYISLGQDVYKVIRIDNQIKDKTRYKEYIVNLKNGDMLCDCPGFQAKINSLRNGKKIKGIVACKHVKGIIEQLKDGGGIIDFNPDPIEKNIF